MDEYQQEFINCLEYRFGGKASLYNIADTLDWCDEDVRRVGYELEYEQCRVKSHGGPDNPIYEIWQ